MKQIHPLIQAALWNAVSKESPRNTIQEWDTPYNFVEYFFSLSIYFLWHTVLFSTLQAVEPHTVFAWTQCWALSRPRIPCKPIRHGGNIARNRVEHLNGSREYERPGAQRTGQDVVHERTAVADVVQIVQMEIVKCTKVLQHKHLDQLLLIALAESVTLRCPPRGDQVLQTYKKQWGEPTRAPQTPWKTSKKNLVIRASRRMECLSLSVYCSSDGHCIRFD